jgi:molecular chaperone GrpE|tara:strand:+ start:1044 stop:1535 length:492 start_codon:yes stop_codon:yes gene_type:complete
MTEKKKEHKKGKSELEVKNDQIKELTETVQRLQADFENYKKQVEKTRLNSCKFAKADFINKILPSLDSFELALKNSDNPEEFKKGIKLIFSQLFQTLEDMGLKPIKTEGKFDPYKHEVLLTEDSDKEDNTILEELQKGYQMEDMVIRHSKVKVAKRQKGDDKK